METEPKKSMKVLPRIIIGTVVIIGLIFLLIGYLICNCRSLLKIV
jgi:hypothetical protein